MVTRHELLMETFEQRNHKHLKTEEVRKAYVMLVVRLAADRTNILTKLPMRKIVGLSMAKDQFTLTAAAFWLACQHKVPSSSCCGLLNAYRSTISLLYPTKNFQISPGPFAASFTAAIPGTEAPFEAGRYLNEDAKAPTALALNKNKLLKINSTNF